MTQKLISIVIPVFNEAGNLDALIARVTGVLAQLSERLEIVFIDDGSTDGTLAKLREVHARDPRIAAVSFSRNFGKELAIAAGLTYVRGDAAIIMDADLQHPPEVALKFVEKWREGYDIVYGDRIDRNTEGAFRKFYARAFYRLFNFLSRSDIPSGAGDFRLLDRKAIDAMNRFKETSRFNKGLYSWIGFKSDRHPLPGRRPRRGRDQVELPQAHPVRDRRPDLVLDPAAQGVVAAGARDFADGDRLRQRDLRAHHRIRRRRAGLPLDHRVGDAAGRGAADLARGAG